MLYSMIQSQLLLTATISHLYEIQFTSLEHQQSRLPKVWKVTAVKSTVTVIQENTFLPTEELKILLMLLGADEDNVPEMVIGKKSIIKDTHV